MPDRSAAGAPTTEPSSEHAFMENVRAARDSGYSEVCAVCGCGIYDENDVHDDRLHALSLARAEAGT